jgi:hypothetical protein
MIMCEIDAQLRGMLGAARMEGEPDLGRVAAVRSRMTDLAHASGRHRMRRRTVWMAGCVVLGLTTVGLAGTQAGRDLVRWIVTPVKPVHFVCYSAGQDAAVVGERAGDRVEASGKEVDPVDTGPLGQFSIAVVERGADPFAGREEARARMNEFLALRDAGHGYLIAMNEEPGSASEPYMTTYSMEYTLSGGDTIRAEENDFDSAQVACARTLPLDEIARLRDAGAGTIIAREESPFGLGDFTIRFALSDGRALNVQTHYPPGTRAERDAIFAETRRLRSELRFAVLDPRSTPSGRVFAVLRYALADGRVVGIVENVPDEAVSADRSKVLLPAGP